MFPDLVPVGADGSDRRGLAGEALVKEAEIDSGRCGGLRIETAPHPLDHINRRPAPARVFIADCGIIGSSPMDDIFACVAT